MLSGRCLIGIFITALLSVNTRYEHKESDIYMGTCSLNATHAVPEEAKDADR